MPRRSDSTIDWEMIWAPVDDTSATALLERVRARKELDRQVDD